MTDPENAPRRWPNSSNICAHLPYLSPRRSLVRKLREALIASSLEDHLTKQRILELYLNIVEWGDGVFGAEAAARRWFHHSAQDLTPAEAVRLAIALPNPFLRAPNVRDAELTKKAVRLVRLLRMDGMISAAEERTALDQLGAPDERVLPDRAEPAPASPAAAGSEPPPPRAEPATAPPAGEPAVEATPEAGARQAAEPDREPPAPGSAAAEAGSPR